MTRSSLSAYRYEWLLVAVFTVAFVWDFFTGFELAYGGILHADGSAAMVKGLFLLVAVAGWLLFPQVYSPSNTVYGIAYALVWLLVYVSNWILNGIQNNDNLTAIYFGGMFFVLLRDDLKVKCFRLAVDFLAIFLALSAVEFVLISVFGIGIRLFAFIERETSTVPVLFDQYLLNLINQNPYTGFVRFQSICEEPGVVGTACGLLLFLTRPLKRFRWHYVVFLVSGLLSFSLAFYVMLVIHFFATGVKRRYLLVAAVLLLFFFFFMELFDVLIIDRLSGRGVGYRVDNRVSEQFNIFFQRAWQNNELWFGHGSVGVIESGSGGEAGAKKWIYMNGIIPLIALVWLYSRYFFVKCRGNMAYGLLPILFFITFWLSFYQRQYISQMPFIAFFFCAPILFGQRVEDYTARPSHRMIPVQSSVQ